VGIKRGSNGAMFGTLSRLLLVPTSVEFPGVPTTALKHSSLISNGINLNLSQEAN
jgi:hypothetical protein